MTLSSAQDESRESSAQPLISGEVATEVKPPVSQLTGKLSPQQFADHMTAAHGRLWGLATALIGDRHEAEDLVQEAAIVAFRKLADFTPDTNFTAWMSKIIRMHALNWRRKQTTRQTAAADPSDIDAKTTATPAAAGEPTVADAAKGHSPALQQDFDDMLLGSLKTLDVTARACLLLRIVHELTYDEIATMLEIPPGTAMSHVHRSKQRLRKDLDTPTN